MDLTEFQDKETDKALLDYLQTVDWEGAEMLYKALSAGEFQDKFGESSRSFYVTDDDKYVGFFNLTEEDYVDVPEYNKFITMLYVDPDYRDSHLSEAFIKLAEGLLIMEGETEAHLITKHEGLYEKYGYERVHHLSEGPNDNDYLYKKVLVDD